MNLNRINPWRRGNRKWALLALIFAASPFFAWLYFRLGRVTHADYGAEAAALVESRLPAGARDPSLPNGWEAVLEMAEAYRAANRALGGSEGDGRPGTALTVINFEEDAEPQYLLGEEVATPTPGESLAALEEAGFFRAADRLTGYARVVAPISETVGEDPFDRIDTSFSQANRGAVRALLVDMRRSAEAGDAERAAARVRQARALARALGLQCDLVHMLYAISASARISRSISTMLMESALTPDVIRALLDAMAGLADVPDAEFMIRCHRLQAIAMAREFYVSVLSRSAPLINPGLPFMIANEREVLNAIEGFMEAALRHAALPQCERSDSESGPDRLLENYGRRLLMAKLPLTMIERLIELIDTTHMHHNATRLHLAVELFVRERGAPPRTLDDLVPQYLAELPADPLAPDGHFRYMLVDPGADPHGRSYLLYSVGVDCTDNAGAMHKRGSIVATTRKENIGYDFVVNEPEAVEADDEGDGSDG